MPVHKCPNGKYRIGSGKCMYDSKEKADKAYTAYLAVKHTKNEKNRKVAKEVFKDNSHEIDLDKLLAEIDKEISDLWDMQSYIYSLKNIAEYESKGVGDKVRILSIMISNELESMRKLKKELDEIKNA